MFYKLNKSGNIPQGEWCPYGKECIIRTARENASDKTDYCKQRPEVEFSCAIARGFDLIEGRKHKNEV